MLRHYCDRCHAEITEANACSGGFPDETRLGGTIEATAEHPAWNVTVLVATEGDWQSGDFCRYCVIDLVNTLDDRP